MFEFSLESDIVKELTFGLTFQDLNIDSRGPTERHTLFRTYRAGDDIWYVCRVVGAIFSLFPVTCGSPLAI